MRFSENWIREWVNPKIDLGAWISQLTMSGLEVKSISDAADSFDKHYIESLSSTEKQDLKDKCIEIDLTANRGDCLSTIGLAREVAALNRLTPPKIPNLKAEVAIKDTFDIQLEALDACPRYLGRVVTGVNSKAQTPNWMQMKLIKSGLRPIHPVVDVLNFVMLEYGQPMHAFDLNCLQKSIFIRFAKSNEQIQLLDEREVALSPHTLVIADQKGPVAIAGVMGGYDSAVSINTESIFLESALFTPAVIGGKSKYYNAYTDSAYRFERGIDPNLPPIALERATVLILEICGGKAGPIIEKSNEKAIPQKKVISLRKDRITKMIGVSFKHSELEEILHSLGCEVKVKAEEYSVLPPSNRYDLELEIDLIEEIARMHGYDNIQAKSPQSSLYVPPTWGVKSSITLPLKRIKRTLVDLGYQEVITYSFVDEKRQQMLNPKVKGILLSNPISQNMALMRTNLWTGLLGVLEHNLNRQQTRMQIFEEGLCFYYDDKQVLEQRSHIAGLLFGSSSVENWKNANRPIDFYDMKGHIEALISLTGRKIQEYKWVRGNHPALHPGQSAILLNHEGKKMGECGAINPEVLKNLGLPGPLFVFELDTALLSAQVTPFYQSYIRFPMVRRDLAFIVAETVLVGELLDAIHNVAGELLQDSKIFDVYSGKGITPGRKSIAIGLILQHPSRTLVEEEIEGTIKKIVEKLNKQFGADLRDEKYGLNQS